MTQSDPGAIGYCTLSMKPEWAWLTVNGYKLDEMRNWCTRYRGPLLVHASGQHDPSVRRWLVERHMDIVIPADIPSGGIVGRVQVIDVVERLATPWSDGERFGLVLAEPEVCEFVPCKGSLQIWQYRGPLPLFTPIGVSHVLPRERGCP